MKLPRLSGQEIVKILVKEFCFEISRQRGSHVVLRKMEKGKKIVTIVPLHEEVKPGTLLGILRLARIRKEEFLEKLK
ncbi:MAG: type II toxin-antitoxin system HicA family toxin [Candidatus Brockarchaeota archaeon]|nr:type II toxin-antitoxin system HicA family toxin [Candidatus Brockarchaeota archaeon]